MSSKKVFKIAVLPGDGIGPEIVPQAIKALDYVAGLYGLVFDFEEALVGGAAIDQGGNPLPGETLKLAQSADAVLLGAVGGPKWEGLDYSIRPERALLSLREKLGLFANLRPAQLFPILSEASALKPEVVEGIDLLVVRELTGGIYFGKPRGIIPFRGGEKGINTEVYTTKEIVRIAQVAFELARIRKKRLTSVDKANVLESSELWRKVVIEVHHDYPDVELNHMYVDNCAMQLVRNPKQFDVVVTTNLFGDILSDEAAMLTGSIGMLPSASLGELRGRGKGGMRRGMYEPIHGSAPDLAGQDKANPIATILSGAMMFRYSFQNEDAAALMEGAVSRVLEEGFRTQDIFTPGFKMVGTREMGDLICGAIKGG
ncbi:MAG TPA: 3-isopropylmalate dehydrogenase [Nitrospiria bacterium]|jgi:3-isopropylmalate dehydrogenase